MKSPGGGPVETESMIALLDHAMTTAETAATTTQAAATKIEQSVVKVMAAQEKTLKDSQEAMQEVLTQTLDGYKQALAAPPHPELAGQLAALLNLCEHPPETEALRRLEDIQHHLFSLSTRKYGHVWLLTSAALLGAVALGMALGWIVFRAEPVVAKRAVLGGAVDAVLQERWDTVPVGIQTAISAAYMKEGFQPPTQRKGKR